MHDVILLIAVVGLILLGLAGPLGVFYMQREAFREFRGILTPGAPAMEVAEKDLLARMEEDAEQQDPQVWRHLSPLAKEYSPHNEERGFAAEDVDAEDDEIIREMRFNMAQDWNGLLNPREEDAA